MPSFLACLRKVCYLEAACFELEYNVGCVAELRPHALQWWCSIFWWFRKLVWTCTFLLMPSFPLPKAFENTFSPISFLALLRKANFSQQLQAEEMQHICYHACSGLHFMFLWPSYKGYNILCSSFLNSWDDGSCSVCMCVHTFVHK